MPAQHPRIHDFAEYKDAYRRSVENPEQFWAKAAEAFTGGASGPRC